ncbi:MAG: hypothetical protein JEZ12_23545 [Desulfobacterium sp.]|nr:hypothetical protein [Desulfobacterium sp.]
MREVKIGDKVIEIRSLTKKEIKQLKEHGYTYLGCRPNMDNLEGVIDDAFDVVLDKETINYLDDKPMSDTKKVWGAILKETYGDPGEEKN